MNALGFRAQLEMQQRVFADPTTSGSPSFALGGQFGTLGSPWLAKAANPAERLFRRMGGYLEETGLAQRGHQDEQENKPSSAPATSFHDAQSRAKETAFVSGPGASVPDKVAAAEAVIDLREVCQDLLSGEDARRARLLDRLREGDTGLAAQLEDLASDAASYIASQCGEHEDDVRAGALAILSAARLPTLESRVARLLRHALVSDSIDIRFAAVASADDLSRAERQSLRRELERLTVDPSADVRGAAQALLERDAQRG